MVFLGVLVTVGYKTTLELEGTFLSIMLDLKEMMRRDDIGVSGKV